MIANHVLRVRLESSLIPKSLKTVSKNTNTKKLISEAIDVATSIPDANAIFLFMTVVYQKGSLREIFLVLTLGWG